MKLDTKENLINLEMYYRDVLGYNCYWKKCDEEVMQKNYGIQLDSEFLIMEVSSILHMLKYCPENVCGDKPLHIEKILNCEIPIPKIAYLWYGNHEEGKHFPPFFMISRMPYEHELYTSTGAKWIYNKYISGMAGQKTLPVLDYFLYCYDRNCSEFQAIPKETVDEIESYLKKQGRLIFNTI